MVEFGGLAGRLASIAAAACAVPGLFFLTRRNGYFRKQLKRAAPVISVEATAVTNWVDARWRIVALSIDNPALVPAHIIAIKILDDTASLLWRYADGMVSDGVGGSVLAPIPPKGVGTARLALDFTIGLPKGHPTKPNPRKSVTHLFLRLPTAGHALPKVRLTYRWKDNDATVITTVATIWEKDAAA